LSAIEGDAESRRHVLSSVLVGLSFCCDVRRDLGPGKYGVQKPVTQSLSAKRRWFRSMQLPAAT
jgi:hypothetical protein